MCKNDSSFVLGKCPFTLSLLIGQSDDNLDTKKDHNNAWKCSYSVIMQVLFQGLWCHQDPVLKLSTECLLVIFITLNEVVSSNKMHLWDA